MTKLYSFVCAVWETEELAERCKLEAPSQVGGVQSRFGRLEFEAREREQPPAQDNYKDVMEE